MKKIALSIVVAGAFIAAAIVYINRQKASPPPTPVAAAEPQPAEQPAPEPALAPRPAPQPAAVAVSAPAPAPVTNATPAEVNILPDTSTNAIHKSVDALLSARSGLEKHNLFQELAKNGQLDAAIDELKQRAAADPGNAEIPATLGEALLNKVRAMRESGITSPTDLGIYALQADQQFSAAIKIDPKNWEANFVQASSKYYWPPDAERDAAAAQQLAGLIDQQDAMNSTSPEFSQTYIALIKQYQKMGKMDEAAATLKIGLQKYPADPTLQRMAAGQ
jgi:tetratricopeptide (TPR) repeat protein